MQIISYLPEFAYSKIIVKLNHLTKYVHMHEGIYATGFDNESIRV